MMTYPQHLFFALLLTVVSPFIALAQPPPFECCYDATCTWCSEVAECEQTPLSDPSDAFSGGTGVCGLDSPFLVLCSSFSENNAFGGVCLSSCNDLTACNYLPSSPNDFDCIYADECEDCDGNCLNDVNGNDICDCFETVGCTDATACNFAPEATLDDGSCIYLVFGFNCDGSCSDEDGDGICLLDEIHGCTDSLAVNYYPIFTEDDGSCLYAADVCDCPADMNGDNFISVADILVILGLFEYSCE